MNIESRQMLEDYAMQLCLPLLERTEHRRTQHIRPVVNDSAGYLLSYVESFCRPLWGIGPVLGSGKQFYIEAEGQQLEVCSWLRQCVLTATDESSPYNWNPVEGMDETSYYNQMKTELAGLLVGMYFARNVLWDVFTPKEQKQIADWIYHINQKAYEVVWDCNHIWFIVLCVTVLKKFGFVYAQTEHILQEGLARLDKMYVENGFYQDGKFGRFDYYNPWAMHTYPLLWSLIADETFTGYHAHCAAYRQRTEELLPYYSHMFDANGCNVPFGRSLTYRFAASSIFPAALAAGCNFDPGLAREITLKNISFFANNAALEDGILPPGFLYNAPQTVENYTSDGGAYWCSKAFLALLLPPEHSFWAAPARQLPTQEPFFVQTGSRKIQMPLTGNANTGVTLYNNTAHYLQDQQKTQWFLDMAGFYSKFAYNSRAGFGISTRDEVSADNMIVLLTPDGTMESHRMGFEVLGTEQEGKVLVSKHQPFSNDAKTYITSKVLILSPEMHMRMHKVVLSQPYRVREGGFCVPQKTDLKHTQCTADTACVQADNFGSLLKTTGTVTQTLQVRSVQPGMHLLAPMACYPAWQSDVLAAGIYYFASLLALGTQLPATLPQLDISGENVVVQSENNQFTISFENGELL